MLNADLQFCSYSMLFCYFLMDEREVLSYVVVRQTTLIDRASA